MKCYASYDLDVVFEKCVAYFTDYFSDSDWSICSSHKKKYNLWIEKNDISIPLVSSFVKDDVLIYLYVYSLNEVFETIQYFNILSKRYLSKLEFFYIENSSHTHEIVLNEHSSETEMLSYEVYTSDLCFYIFVRQ